jgi:hypothetical protein
MDWILVTLIGGLFMYIFYLRLQLRARREAWEALQQAVIIMPAAKPARAWPVLVLIFTLLALAIVIGLKVPW